MGVRKEAKDEIVKLMLQDVPTEEIANIMGYSVGTVRKVFEELREEYGVNSKTGIAKAYLQTELINLYGHIKNILNLLGGGQIATPQRRRRDMQKTQKKSQKKKN